MSDTAAGGAPVPGGLAHPGASRRVLVTDGGDGQGRSALAAVRALDAAGWEPVVTVSGGRSLAAASRACRARITVPRVEEVGAYTAAVRRELARGYHAVLACSDAALLALGAPVEPLVDKQQLAVRAADAGLSAVEGRRVTGPEGVGAAADELGWPVVVKPVVSTVPARRVASAEELPELPADVGELLVQPWVDGPMSAVGGVVHDGRIVAAVHQRYLRTWPVDCGTACAAVTIPPDGELEDRLETLLDGYSGPFQAQFRAGRLLDCNPRVYGSLPLAVRAGANLAGVWCDLLDGREVGTVRARPGVAYRWLEGDLRHLAHEIRHRRLGAGAALAALRPRRGTAHSVASLRDPGPVMARLRHVLRRVAAS